MNLMKLSVPLFVAGTMVLFTGSVNAQQNLSQTLEFNLFQNFQTAQGPSTSTAVMYNAPHPVPYWTGSSQYTYQPFYPHQHLYQHQKSYYNYYGTSDQFYSDNQFRGRGGDALNKTTVTWTGGGYHFGNFPLSTYAGQKLIYGINARKYGLNGGGGIGGSRGYGLSTRGCAGGCN